MSRTKNAFSSVLAIAAMAALASVAKADHEIAPPVGPPTIAPPVQYSVAYSLPYSSTRVYSTYGQACHFRDWLSRRAGVFARINRCYRGYEVRYSCRRPLTRTFLSLASAREFRGCLSDSGFTCRVRTLRQPGCVACGTCGGIGACQAGCTCRTCRIKARNRGGLRRGLPLGPLTGILRFRY